MRQINPEKLLLSKWTAITPQNRERHFIVTKLIRDEKEQVTGCELEAVINRNSYRIAWQELKNRDNWQIGWK